MRKSRVLVTDVGRQRWQPYWPHRPRLARTAVRASRYLATLVALVRFSGVGVTHQVTAGKFFPDFFQVVSPGSRKKHARPSYRRLHHTKIEGLPFADSPPLRLGQMPNIESELLPVKTPQELGWYLSREDRDRPSWVAPIGGKPKTMDRKRRTKTMGGADWTCRRRKSDGWQRLEPLEKVGGSN